MSKASKRRSTVKRPAPSKPARSARGQGSKRQTPGQLGKAQVLARIMRDTGAIRQGSLLIQLRRQGYEELPLEEIQDRLSKLRTALAEFIVSGRG